MLKVGAREDEVFDTLMENPLWSRLLGKSKTRNRTHPRFINL